MIDFVNAKINIGLQIVNRRPDGYHDLQTLFYPIGRRAGCPDNPVEFCDLLEVSPRSDSEIWFESSGRAIDCPLEKNLVLRAARLFYDSFHPDFGVDILLDKHIPDGAGIGGGSADAAFTLRLLRDVTGVSADDNALAALALSLGADCPFFIYNRPLYAAGVGERFEEPSGADPLAGKWLLLVKPDVYISTREAFAGVTPHPADFDLRSLFELPLNRWPEFVHNDFEDSIFPNYPEFGNIKAAMYDCGALYSSLTGSGSCLYGIYADPDIARRAQTHLAIYPTITASYLLKL